MDNKSGSYSPKDRILPFLKWPGGKRWFVSRYAILLPSKYNRYIEPFLGGGSVFFFLEPKRSILGDKNVELIATYKCIRDDWVSLEKLLEKHQKKHSETYYYKVREKRPADLIEKAARFIYLNRTCFNGIYRVNLAGKFNVPKGEREAVILETDDFENVSRLLANVELRVADFEELVNEARKNDLIFADPPYTVRHNQNGFVKYNETLFSWEDQERLAESLARAKNRGVKIVSTNANSPLIRALYDKRGFDLRTVSRFSSISADPKSRKPFDELVILGNL
jgi:DNA adenine methylase